MENLEAIVAEDVTEPIEEAEASAAQEVEVSAEPESDYVEKKEEDDKDSEKTESESEAPEKEDKDDEEKKESAKKYASLEAELNTLKESYSILQSQYQELVAFRTSIENQQKDQLISEFFMLSDEDKADVIANKGKYSLDEIKAKLSVICFDKKINFTLGKKSEEEVSPVTTYNLNSTQEKDLPDWVKAVKEQQELV